MTATVLIADDDKQIRQAFRRLLAAIPKVAVVAEARDGEEAVRLALEHRPSVVVMDISMPNMDGVEATRRIRASAPEILVVVVTADSSPEVFQTCFDVGADAFIAKVAAADELPRALTAVAHGERFTSPCRSKPCRFGDS